MNAGPPCTSVPSAPSSMFFADPQTVEACRHRLEPALTARVPRPGARAASKGYEKLAMDAGQARTWRTRPHDTPHDRNP